MNKEELKNKCKERAKIFQQAMESCHSNNPIDCIEWFADRITELEAENEQIKNSDTLCKLIGEQKRKITELEQQIEKMKNCKNCDNWNWKHNKCEKKLKGDCFKHSKWVMRNF